MIFKHTAREKGMWRGWLKNGQALELSWNRRGWQFGGGIHIHGNDDDLGDRLLFLHFWRAVAVIPLGVIAHPWERMEAPQWSASVDAEHGILLHWGHWRKFFDLPWHLHTLAYEEQMPDGSWRAISYDEGEGPYKETHSYTYTLRDGTVQRRTATISKRRHVLTWRALKVFGWPRWVRESIDVQFSDEVGERSGSWKGGCIGCGYDLRKSETLEQALRRMERERKF